jgi:hypothetical protein
MINLVMRLSIVFTDELHFSQKCGFVTLFSKVWFCYTFPKVGFVTLFSKVWFCYTFPKVGFVTLFSKV